jgi:NADPH-dependent ferric siderophore reductase
MARVTLRGGTLGEFTSLGPDQFIYVFPPLPGRETEPPVALGFKWDDVREVPREQWPVGRYYTVRAHRPELAELDVDIVLHGDGPGAAFGTSALPGQVVAIWGPRIAYEPHENVRTVLMVADQTGLPAIGAILDNAKPGIAYHAIIEVPDDAEAVLETCTPAHVTWRYGHGFGLVEHAREVATALDRDGLYIWGACETDVAKDLRALFEEEFGMRGKDVSILAYWNAAKDAR